MASPWLIDLDTGTVTHCEGWVFQFEPSAEEPGTYGSWCRFRPAPKPGATGHHVRKQEALAKEAGLAFLEALAAEE